MRLMPASFAARYITPLSGPTKRAPEAVSSAIGSRVVPTPGSTTATNTVRFGKKRQLCASAIAPAVTDCGGMPCVMSMMRASGAMEASTPFIAPT